MLTKRKRRMTLALIATAASVLVAAGCGKNKPSNPDDGGSGGTGGAGALGGAGGAGGRGGAGGAGIAQKLVILHTNDIHSHFLGQGPERDYTPATLNDDTTKGGLARLATAISAAKTAAITDGAPVLLLDAGDFEMGTLFEFLAQSVAPELRFMQAMGYDATTIGNHELDWTPLGLAGILKAAMDAHVTVPVLSSNMSFSATDTRDDALKALFDAGMIQTKLVKTVGSLKVGFFGLLGKDAVQVTPQAAPLAFEAIVPAATRMVTELRTVDKVDLVIALSHSGIDSMGNGEDAVLAAMVPGIDVIVSGHTHDTLMQPKVVNKTLIVTAGSYGRYLGDLKLSVTPAATAGGQATVVLDGYQLKSIDDSIAADPVTQTQIDAFVTGLDTTLAPAQLSYAKVVAKTPADLPLPAFAEAPVGNLVTDGYRLVVSSLQMAAPPALAVEGNGQLRSSILKGTTGEVWFSDLFRVTPIGIGPDQRPGYPLVTFYLNAKDISSGLELGAATELVADQYFLQVSGLKVEYDMKRPIFGRVAGLTLTSGATEQPLDITNTTTCYKVVATSYVAGLLGVVNSFTQGLLSVVAKDSDCLTPIDPTTRYVDADPATAGVQELKHWQAVLSYVSKFPADAGGVPVIPVAYTTPQGRIVKR